MNPTSGLNFNFAPNFGQNSQILGKIRLNLTSLFSTHSRTKQLAEELYEWTSSSDIAYEGDVDKTIELIDILLSHESQQSGVQLATFTDSSFTSKLYMHSSISCQRRKVSLSDYSLYIIGPREVFSPFYSLGPESVPVYGPGS